MWVLLGFASAIFLGTYDIFKKISLKDNAVIPVLFFSILTSSCILFPIHLVSIIFPEATKDTIFNIPTLDFSAHILIFIKSLIVLSSWLFAYFAVKHLPITIASPIKATQPVWIVLGAVLFFGEVLSPFQTLGIVVTLCAFYLFSVAGMREGFSLKNNKWIWFIIFATLTGAASGLYDKYLMKELPNLAVQTYYTYYQALVMGLILLILWYPNRKNTTPFQWRKSIIFISVLLVMADFCYFLALSMDGSLIAVISTLRRSGVVIPFLFGIVIMKEKNLKHKLLPLIGILAGILFLFLGSK
jgi:drug/metabolite transporter (DMT)-like permease